jgi:hypothetical protein
VSCGNDFADVCVGGLVKPDVVEVDVFGVVEMFTSKIALSGSKGTTSLFIVYSQLFKVLQS